MANQTPVGKGERLAHPARHPVLSTFASPFPKLLDPGARVEESFQRMAKLLGAVDRAAVIQVTIREADRSRSWGLALGPEGTTVTERAYERPTLEIITGIETWSQIAGGSVSPLDAFGQGQVRVRGDITLARFLARRLQGR